MSISVKNCLLYNIFSVFGLVLFLATSRKFFGDVIFSVCFKIDLTKGISVFRYEKKTDSNRNRSLEATPRFELGNKGFADLCLTTWLWRRIQITKDAYFCVFCLVVNGAEDEIRTRDVHLGKVTLYH